MTRLNITTQIDSTDYWHSVKRFDSAEGNVAKFVFEKQPEGKARPAVVESVLYKYPTYKDRTVICCSTQSGCPMGCRFCGAGDYFVRSLRAEEIVDQVSYSIEQTGLDASAIDKLQIMFMSMGEPALNQKGLCEAIRQLHHLYPHARLLISTSAPDVDYTPIFDVSREVETVGLQFSVHESTDMARDKLIPFAKKMDLQKIADTGRAWFEHTGRKPFFNYCAHDDNSSVEDALRIKNLFDPTIWEATISVICERNEGMPTRNEHQLNLAADFSSKLIECGFNTRVFDPAGQDDIGGGCGQLWYVQDALKNNYAPNGYATPSIGHSKPTVHVPKAELASLGTKNNVCS